MEDIVINQSKKYVSETQLWTIIISIVLLLVIMVGAIFFFVGRGKFRGESLSKEEIAENIAAYDGGHSWVADAIYDLGFSVNKQKIKNVELAYKQ